MEFCPRNTRRENPVADVSIQSTACNLRLACIDATCVDGQRRLVKTARWASLLREALLRVRGVRQLQTPLIFYALPTQRDIDHFSFLKIMLELEKTQAFFSLFDFSDSFYLSELKGLREFIESWKRLDNHFDNPEIEAAGALMYSRASALLELVNTCTFPLTFLPGRRSVKLNNGSDRDQPKKVWESAKKINVAARAFAASHEALLSLGERTLHVEATCRTVAESRLGGGQGYRGRQ